MLKTIIACILLAAAPIGAAQAQGQPQERSAASIECSRQATEKGLHGKARKHFRSKCLKAAKKRE